MRYLRSQSALLWITLAAMAANFFLAIYGTYEVVYASNQLHAGPAVFGILLGVNSAGFGIGAVLVGRLHIGHKAGMAFSIAWGFSGLMIVVLALVSSVPVAIAAVAGFGILGGFGNTVWLSAVQQTVPDQFLGRYFSMDEAGSFAMIPLGQIAGGFVITAYGVAVAYGMAGVGAAVVSFTLLLHPGVRAWGSPRVPPTADSLRSTAVARPDRGPELWADGAASRPALRPASARRTRPPILPRGGPRGGRRRSERSSLRGEPITGREHPRCVRRMTPGPPP
jgi:MFS family permease